MGIEKTIEINVDSKQAEKNLKEINVTIDEQKEILVLLEEEYIKAKQALDKYNDSGKVNLAQEKQLKQQLTERKNALTDQRLGLKKLAVEQRAANKTVNDFKLSQKDNTNIIRGIDKLTGGYATKVIKLKKGFLSAIKGVKGFALGLKGLRGALIATGIGALAVGIGLVVANFDKIKESLGFVSAESKAATEALEKEAEALNQAIAKQAGEIIAVTRAYENGALKGENLKNVVNDLNEKYEDANLELDENNELTADSLAFIDSQVKAIKVQAKNKAILTNIEALYSDELQAQTLIGQENNKFMVERAKLEGLLAQQAAATTVSEKRSFKRQIESSQFRQKSIAKEITALTRQRARIQSAIDSETRRLDFSEFSKPKKSKKRKSSGKSQEDIEKQEAKKLSDLKDKIRDAEANKEDEARALELKKIKEHNAKLLKEAEDADLLTQELKDSLNEKLEAKQAEFDKIDEKRKKKKEEEEAKDKLKQQEKIISNLEITKGFEELNFQEQKEKLKEREAALLLDKVFFKTLTNEQILELEAQFSEAKVEIGKKEIEIEAEKTAAKKQALDEAISLAGAESEIGKALLILKQGLALKEMVMEAKKTITFGTIAAAKSGVAVAEGTAQTAKVGFPQNVPLLIGYAAQAAGIISAITSATGKAKSAASSAGGGGGTISTPSVPPSFNIVGASSSNQLAEAIGGQEQQPVQAYVVANDVTTAQSLQNNIVEGATIG